MGSGRGIARNGVTLVELLVVIAIIGILIAILLPAVQAVRESARRTYCSNNIRQIALALIQYNGQHQSFPPESIWASGRKGAYRPRNHTWIALTLPFFEQQALYDAIDFKKPIWGQKDSAGRSLAAAQLKILTCPSDIPVSKDGEGSHGMGYTNYAGAEGYDWWDRRQGRLGGIFTLSAATEMTDIKDGATNTLLLGEVTSFGFQGGGHLRTGGGRPRTTAAEAVFRPAFVSPPYSDSQGSLGKGYPAPDGSANPHPSWKWWKTNPKPYKPTYLHCFGINGEWPGAHSRHPQGANFALADGVVKFLKQDIDYPGETRTKFTEGAGVWGAMNTKRGAERVVFK